MIDLHSHLLPLVDDGARSLDEALALARVAVEDGIGTMVLTPHVFPGRWDNTYESLLPHFVAFRRMLEQAGIPLKVMLGGETRMSPEGLALLATARVPLIGRHLGRAVVLLEMPDGLVPPGIDSVAAFLEARGATAMIAHPERNRAVMRDPSLLEPMLRHGWLMQVTAGALTGDFGAPARHCAFELLRRGWIHVIASDAHNLRNRPPRMRAAREVIAGVAGEAFAVAMTQTRPAELIAGRTATRVVMRGRSPAAPPVEAAVAS